MKDDEEAVKWFREAVKQDNEYGQYNLGLMYYNGYGVQKDFVQADLWWIVSSAKGNKTAIENKKIGKNIFVYFKLIFSFSISMIKERPIIINVIDRVSA